MKINHMIVVVAVLAIAGVAYYLQHHNINMNVDVKSDNGSKSHMGMKHEAAKPKHDKHADDDNA